MLKHLLKLFGLVGNKKESEPVKKVYKPLPKGKVIAKMLGGYDAEFMYGDGVGDPGLCPVCHNVLRKIPNLDYRMQKKEAMSFILMISFALLRKNLKTFVKRMDMKD